MRFVVRFKSGDEQPVIADRAMEDEESPIFLNGEGGLAAFFDLSVVEEWHAENSDTTG